MNLNLKFLQSFKVKKTFKKESTQINSDKYWNFLLVLFFVMLLVSMMFGFFLFEKSNEDFKDYVPKETYNDSLNQKNQILKVLEYFEIKENNTKEIIEKGVTVVDPSF